MDPKNASHTKLGSESSKACWECIRRSIDCDGSRPVCKKCLESGIVCPGFHNKKPLVWVTPGKVTHRAPQRPRRKKGILTDDASKSKASIGTTLVCETRENPETATALVIRSHASKQALTPASSSCSDHSSMTSPKTGQYTTASYEFADIDWGTDSTEGSKELAKQNRCSPSSTESFSPELYKALQLANTVPASLLVGDYELVGALDYYISQIYMPQANREVVQNLHRPPTVSIDEMLPEMQSPCRRHSFMAIISAHRIFSASRNQWSGVKRTDRGAGFCTGPRFYHHLGRAIQELYIELSSENGALDPRVFTTIWMLLGAGVSQDVLLGVLAHINGLLALIDLQGGLQKVMALRAPHWGTLQASIVSCVLTYTTSPPSHQLVKASLMEMSDLLRLYTWTAIPDLLCPADLFVSVVRINRLRFQAANSPSITTEDHLTQSIMDEIWGFKPEQWAQSSGFPHENQVVLIGRVFQYSVALYAILSVPGCAHDFELCCEDNGDNSFSRHQLHRLLFKTIDQAMDTLYIETMSWPLAVAGVVARTSSERASVIENIDRVIDYFGFIKPVHSLKEMLREHWGSGKSGWDDCFHRVHYFI